MAKQYHFNSVFKITELKSQDSKILMVCIEVAKQYHFNRVSKLGE